MVYIECTKKAKRLVGLLLMLLRNFRRETLPLNLALRFFTSDPFCSFIRWSSIYASFLRTTFKVVQEVPVCIRDSVVILVTPSNFVLSRSLYSMQHQTFACCIGTKSLEHKNIPKTSSRTRNEQKNEVLLRKHEKGSKRCSKSIVMSSESESLLIH